MGSVLEFKDKIYKLSRLKYMPIYQPYYKNYFDNLKVIKCLKKYLCAKTSPL